MGRVKETNKGWWGTVEIAVQRIPTPLPKVVRATRWEQWLLVKGYSQVPVTWEKGVKEDKHPDLTLFLPLNLLLVSPMDKPNQKLEGKRAHGCSLLGHRARQRRAECCVWKGNGKYPAQPVRDEEEV